MKETMIIVLMLLLSLLFAGCSGDQADISSEDGNSEQVEQEAVQEEQVAEGEQSTLMISAAVSLTDALEEIKELYESDNNIELTFNLGGSGSLTQQIQQGAPVDVFVSANQKWMDTLDEEKLIVPDTRVDITGNKIVLIADESSSLAYESFADIQAEDVEQIAIGNPESVPAGKYTEELLQNLNKMDELADKLVLAKDVRQVLTYVETGNVDIGFVYESDAFISEKVKILAKSDEGLHEPIIYPAAVIADSKNEQVAKDFVSYMKSEQAQIIFKKYGFEK